MIKKVIEKVDKELIRHFVLYGIIGAASATVDYLVFNMLVNHLNMYVQLGNVVSVNCGILTSFLLNRNFNFKIKDNTRKRFFSFYSIGILGLLISAAILFIGHEMLKMDQTYVKLFSIFVVAGIQFILNKLLTFKKIWEWFYNGEPLHSDASI